MHIFGKTVNRMQNVSEILKKKVGHGNQEKWIIEEMGMKPRTFNYQINNGTMRFRDIVKLLDILGITFEDLKQPVYNDTEIEVASAEEPVETDQDITIEDVKPERLSDLFS